MKQRSTVHTHIHKSLDGLNCWLERDEERVSTLEYRSTEMIKCGNQREKRLEKKARAPLTVETLLSSNQSHLLETQVLEGKQRLSLDGTPLSEHKQTVNFHKFVAKH